MQKIDSVQALQQVIDRMAQLSKEIVGIEKMMALAVQNGTIVHQHIVVTDIAAMEAEAEKTNERQNYFNMPSELIPGGLMGLLGMQASDFGSRFRKSISKVHSIKTEIPLPLCAQFMQLLLQYKKAEYEQLAENISGIGLNMVS